MHREISGVLHTFVFTEGFLEEKEAGGKAERESIQCW